VLSDARLHAGRNRVLLLGRPAGAWWRRVRAHVRRPFNVKALRLPLEPLPDSSGDRTDLFVAAWNGFAGLLGVGGAPSLPAPRAWPGSHGARRPDGGARGRLCAGPATSAPRLAQMGRDAALDDILEFLHQVLS
jgi:hypothetical protein